MTNYYLEQKFDDIAHLIDNIDYLVPIKNIGGIDLRGELAGMVTVYIVANYENCIKETLLAHASNKDEAFAEFVGNQFDKLNSKIRVGDLKKIASKFSDQIRKDFDILLKGRKNKIEYFTKRDIVSCYDLILNWRHNFAHTGAKDTTLEEAWLNHRFAKYVIIAFDQAFNGKSY